MPRRLVPLPPSLGDTFTRRAATQAGVPPNRLRAPDIRQPIRGVYLHAPAEQSETERPKKTTAQSAEEWRKHQFALARAYQEIMPGHLFYVRRTAAVVRGLPVPFVDSDDLEVACFAPLRPRHRRGVKGCQVRPELAETTEYQGLRVAAPASIWAMLGSELSLDDLVALGDAIIRIHRIPGTSRTSRTSLARPEQMEEIVYAGHRTGIDALRTALSLLSPHAASPPESHLRLRLGEWGFPAPSLDHDVYDAEGRLLGCSEIAFPQYRVVLEYEGDHHRTGKDQWNRDIEKYHAYVADGWFVVRATATLLYRTPHVLRQRIHDVLTSRGWRPGPVQGTSR